MTTSETLSKKTKDNGETFHKINDHFHKQSKVDSYIRALENDTLDEWHDRHDKRNKKLEVDR